MKNKSDDSVESSQNDHKTFKKEGVQTLLGEPKKAIVKLAFPMIIAMSINTIYNVVDAIWVSGLGADELSAVGYFFPFMIILMSISVGLGVGGGSAVSRRIGARDKSGADSVANHTIVLMIILAILITIPLLLFSREIFVFMRAGSVIALATDYARIMFAGAIIILFTQVANALLRGEGDTRRAMYAMMIGAILNIILDPIFIYTFKLGVSGAALASIISLFLTSSILFYWLFAKKDTFLTLTLRNFKFNKHITNDIIRVGFPSMIMQLSMAISVFIFTIIVRQAGGNDGVAIYTIGWRVVMIAILPLLGIATAVTSVTGAAFGSKSYKKLDTAYIHAVKIGFLLEIILAFFTYLLAEQIVFLFTNSSGSEKLADETIVFLRTMCLYYPMVSLGMFSSAMFQGIGKGFNAFIVTFIRTIILSAPLTYILAVIYDYGLSGVWWGIVISNIIGSIIAFIWAKRYIHTLLRIEKNDILT